MRTIQGGLEVQKSDGTAALTVDESSGISTAKKGMATSGTAALGDGSVGTVSVANISILRHNSNVATTVAGLSGGVNGQFVYILNSGSSTITLTHTLSVGNYFICPGGTNFVIPAYGAVCVLFTDVWHVISK